MTTTAPILEGYDYPDDANLLEVAAQAPHLRLLPGLLDLLKDEQTPPLARSRMAGMLAEALQLEFDTTTDATPTHMRRVHDLARQCEDLEVGLRRLHDSRPF